MLLIVVDLLKVLSGALEVPGVMGHTRREYSKHPRVLRQFYGKLARGNPEW